MINKIANAIMHVFVTSLVVCGLYITGKVIMGMIILIRIVENNI